MRFLTLAFAVVVGLFVSGCSTGQAQKKETDVLRNRVSQLESEIGLRERRQREVEAELLRQQELNQALEAKLRDKQEAAPSIGEAPIAPGKLSVTAVRQIQTALAHAGYDPGSIDGKMGQKTQTAVKAFQRANGLSPDGKVGNKTWSKLARYVPRETKGSQK